MEEEDKIKKLVLSETKRQVTKIFKNHLMVVEDLKFQHDEILNSLKKHLTPEQFESLNYLDFMRYSLMRKRTLDNGNEGIRDLENFLENFEFKLKNKDIEIVKIKQTRKKEL